MKKVLSIALAALIAMTAVASFAIVSREGAATGAKLWFDSASVSTSYALADYGLAGVSVLADPAKTYVANEMIFGYVKFGYDQRKPDAWNNDNSAIRVVIQSDYATFPMYLNTPGPGRTHYLNPQGALPVFPAIAMRLGLQFTVTNIPNPTLVVAGDNETFELWAVARDGTIGTTVMFGVDSSVDRMKTAIGVTDNVTKPFMIDDGDWYTDLYVGFNGIVKASTASEGIIKVYVQEGGRAKFATGQLASVGSLAASNSGITRNGVPTFAHAPYINIYKDGKKLYRVMALGANAYGNGIAREYLCQPAVDNDTFETWAIGFQNDNNKKFSRFTYREGLAAKGDNVVAATVGLTDLVGLNGTGLAINKLWENAATIDFDGTHYKFFKVESMVQGQINQYITKGNALDPKLQAAMDTFGFSYGYYNATRNSDYEVGGYKNSKDLTFKYFGADITTDDDTVIPAETGDASATIVIVLAASALLAAAALFFVMKKARD